MLYNIRVKNEGEKLQIQAELQLAWSREEFPRKIPYSEIILKALKRYNDDYVFKPQEVK